MDYLGNEKNEAGQCTNCNGVMITKDGCVCITTFDQHGMTRPFIEIS